MCDFRPALTVSRGPCSQQGRVLYRLFFNLSVGIERSLKAIVIIDHMLTNQLAVPNKNQLQGYGHNVVDLYDVCVTIGTTRRSVVPNRSQLDAIDQELLRLISDFARVTRYHNLDALDAQRTRRRAEKENEPAHGWYSS